MTFWRSKDNNSVRSASHAGSWYNADPNELAQELENYISSSNVKPSSFARAIIAPHAGYYYSGRCAAHAFSLIDTEKISRIFLLGPSHHFYTRKCCLSPSKTFKTPFGDIDIDITIYEELYSTGHFEIISPEKDEAEHSLEMHVPYLHHVFKDKRFTLVPIMVGSLSHENEEKFGKILSKYIDDPANFFSVSSDFCHWGKRFNYTPYIPHHGPIHKYIEHLDKQGMEIIEKGDPLQFKEYLKIFENTICGRHPTAILLHILKHCSFKHEFKFVRYEQSSACSTFRDSSVSYASGVALIKLDSP